MIMKNQKVNCLLIALSGALCLSACNSGTSSSPTPTPTPSPSPTPTPTPPGPTPTPTPVAGESGVYAVSAFSLSMSFATQPSAANWVNFTSGTTNSIAGLVATESRIALLDRPAVIAADTSSQYNIYGGTQIQLIAASTSLPVTITGGAAADGTLPLIPATQIATNGSNVVVAAPSTVDNAYAVSAYTLYSIAANGKPSAITSYYNTSGTSTALAPVAAQPVVVFINGMYYAYNVVAGSVLYSQNGTTWQQALITGGAGSNIDNVVQVSGNTFALQTGVSLFLGSGPFNFGTSPTISFDNSNDFIAANGNGYLYTYDNSDYPGQIAVYTPIAVSLGAPVALSTAPLSRPQQMILAGNNIYLLSTTGALELAPINGNTISAPVIAQTTTKTPPTYLQAPPAFGGFIATMGSQVLMVNNENTYADYNSGDINAVTNNGSISAVSAVNPSNGVASFVNLATGMNLSNDIVTNPIPSRQTLIAGFAGTQTGYMMALTNGSVLVSSESGFVEAAPILHPLDGTTGEGMPADVGQLVSTNGSYLAADNNTSGNGTNLYFSDNNGASWTDIPAASLPVIGASYVTITTQNSYYFIIFDGGAEMYQTATPQNLASWVQVSNFPLVTNSTKINKQVQAKGLNSHQLNTNFIGSPYKYYNGTYYEFYGDTSLGVYNQATGETAITDGILPQDTGYQNIAYNGTTFAIAQEASNYIWTASSLTGGPTSWTQNSVTYNGVSGTMDLVNSVNAFLWTGKIWILGNSMVGSSFGSPPTGYVFSSTNLTSWNAATYTQPATGTQTYIIGQPKLF